jgi:C_GCAxxG_C_C family probable redox protein
MMSKESFKALQESVKVDAPIDSFVSALEKKTTCFPRRQMLTFLSAFVGTMAVSDAFAAPKAKDGQTKAQAAVGLFGKVQCSPAVLAPFAPRYGLDKNMALKLTAGLGAGACAAELCGAVNAAVMVISLKYGYTDMKDGTPKNICDGKVAEFLGLFNEKYKGKLTCRDLLGCDVTKPEGLKQAMDNNLFGTICPAVISHAATILEELGY